MEKRIIFIGGTSRSGSTLLDLILSNDPKAKSLGEIYALFYPTRKHHFNKLETLRKDPVWSFIIKDGKRNLYSNLIKFFPYIDIFVDSSKDPYWIKYNQRKIKDLFIVKNVLIHKTPVELAQSFYKRNLGNKWIRTYISYHRKYLVLIDNFITVKYRELVENESTLEALCIELGIKYFNNKKCYWNNHHDTFFGSDSVKDKTNTSGEDKYRNDITYDVLEENLANEIKIVLKRNKKISKIAQELDKYDLHNTSSNIKPSLGFNKLRIFCHMLWKWIKRKYRYYIPNDIIRYE